MYICNIIVQYNYNLYKSVPNAMEHLYFGLQYT